MPLKILGDTRTRTFVILIGVVVIGGIAFAFMQIGDNDDLLAQRESKILAPPSSLKGVVGNVTPEKYTKLLQEENRNRALEAEKSSQSAIPTIIKTLDPNAQNGGTLGGDGKNIFGDMTRGGFEGDGSLFGENGGPRPKTDAELREERLQAERDRLAAERAARENEKEAERLRKLAEQQRKAYEDSISRRAKAMQSHAQAAFASWGALPRQAYAAGALSKEYDDEVKRLLGEDDGSKKSKPSAAALVSANNAVPGSNRFNNPNAAIKKNIIKAGTVAFGVLDTSVSSDEPGPILASIVGGKLKGGKLVGSISVPKNGEKMILNFNTLNLPKMQNSVRVSVVAIDSNTARTALASDVDHHYLLRYGSLFASSFIDGLSKAISNPPGTQNSPQQSGTGNVAVNTVSAATLPPGFTDLEKYGLVPLGKVGEEWGKAVKPLFNTPPTITVDQGTSIGLLFLSDLDLTPTEGA